MLAREQKFLEFAAQCEQRASRAENGTVAAQFRDLALQWRNLATLVREMADDSKRATDFFKLGH